MASFSVALILLPNDAIDYGTAGVAIIISKLTGFQLSICVLFVLQCYIRQQVVWSKQMKRCVNLHIVTTRTGFFMRPRVIIKSH